MMGLSLCFNKSPESQTSELCKLRSETGERLVGCVCFCTVR